jgi:hypothetical protein
MIPGDFSAQPFPSGCRIGNINFWITIVGLGIPLRTSELQEEKVNIPQFAGWAKNGQQ